MNQQRPLPRPSRLEWIGIIGGIMLIVVGVALAGHVGWWRVLALAGLVSVTWTGYRVRTRRIDAIRARPPL